MRFSAGSLIIACLLAGFAIFKASPVFAQTPPGFAKVFDPATIDPGGISTLTFTIDGTGVGDSFDIEFTDNLSGFLRGVVPTVTNLPQRGFCDLGSNASTSASTGELVLSVAGVTVLNGSRCELVVEFTIPADLPPGDYTNTTSELTARQGTIDNRRIVNSPPAEATLTVNASDAPGFSKAFSPSTIDPGGISRLTFTIDNGANGIEAAGLAFTDAFPAGLVVAGTPNGSTTCTGGTFAPGASDVSLAFTGGAVAAGVSCTISVDVTSAVAGSYPNTSGELTSDLPDAAPPASATLTVDEAPLIALMSFSPSTIAQGGVSRLSYDLRNDAVVGATSISLSDTLPADVAVAPEPNAATTCGGTLTAAAGGDTIAFADGELAAGDTCAISVDVTSAVAGSYSNGPEAVTSSLGASTAAPATLTVNASDAPGFSKAFSPSTIDPGGISRLTFTIDNGANGIEAAGLAFTDAFPAGLVVAGTPNGSTTCTGGTFAPGASDVSLAFTGGAVAAGVSCTISVDVTSAVAGSYPNTSGELTSDLPDAAPPASATLTVDEAPLIALMSFSPSTIAQGGVSRLSYDLRNDAVVGATSISLSDTLPADVAVAPEPNAATTCGGTLTAAAGGDTIAFADGELGAGDTCAIALDVTSAVAGSYSNGPEAVTSSLGASTAAPATLTVNASDAPGFSKAFSPSTIDPGGISRLTFTIDNGANGIEAAGLAFTDAFPAGLVVAGTPNGSTTCTGGTFAPGASDVSLAFTGGAVAAGVSCTISVDVTSAVAGSYPNTSGELTSDLPDAAPPASATLTVDEAPLIALMSFSPSTIAQGGVSRLSYDLRNDAVVGATSISLSDTLPADVAVAPEPNAATTCGGTLTAAAGGDTIAFADGELGAGDTCAIALDVTSAVAGSYSNGPEAVTSSLGASTAAPATLTVNASDAPGFSKAFSPSTIDPGGISRLTFTIDNGANGIEAAGLAFTDAFPAGLVVAGTPNGSTTCTGGTFAPGASDVSLAFTGGAVAAGVSCTISVDVTSAVAGSYPNTSGELTSDLPDAAPPASATLTVDEAPLIALMSFSPSTIAQGGVSRLSYDLRNDAVVGATSISLSDTLPADVAVADAPNAATTCGGTLTAAAGGDTIAFADGELAAGDTCAISVDVTSAVAGSYSNGPEAVTSSLGASTAAPATLTVNASDAPGFSKAFSPSTIDPGGISRLTFTIDNGANGIEAAGLAFTDAFPAGLVVAGTPNGSTTCTGGTFAPGASDVSLAFTGGAVAAGVSCTISVDVTSAVAGSYPNTSGELTSDLPDAAPPASATLTVDEAPLIALMSFSPSTIAQGGVSRLSYDLRNDAVVRATSISLSDTLPADVAVADAPNAATTCGGTLTAAAGGDTIAFADGELAAGDTCAISVDVTSAVAGSYSNGPEAVTSSLGASTAAPATLTVNASDAPGFSKAFSPSTIDPGGISRLTFTIDNGANGIEAAGLAFTDAFPAGLVVAGTPNGSTTCTGGTFAPGASDVSLAFTGGAVAAGVSCTISVDVTSAVAGSYPNTSGELTSDLPDAAPPASATLTVDEAPLIALMSFSPSTIAQGGVSRLSYDLRNDAVVGATSISLSDTLPADVAVADAPNAATTCGGTLTAAAGGDTIAFADGELAAGDTCAISVDVTSAVAGSYSNGPEAVTSSLGASTAAPATLTVNASDAPGFSKAFSPSTIDPGGISRLTFTIDNGANGIEAAGLAFTDAFPAGLVVAGTPNGSTTCTGGTFAPGASDVSLAFTGGAVAAGVSCTISVDVTSAVAGSYPNTSGELTSDLPDAAPPASATLTVDEAPLIALMSFSPSTIAQGGVSRLSYDLRNDAVVGATSISLSDTLPADVAVADAPNAATTCGGTLTAAAGGDTIAFADGELAAGDTCAISVDVTSAVAGSYSNGPEAVTSSLGASTAAPATLTVNAADAPGFSKAFSPSTIDPGGISRLTFTIDNGANGIEAAGLAFTDAFPAGLVVAGTPNGSTTCTGGTFAPGASDVSLAFTGGAVAAGVSCTISVDVTSAVAGSYPNTSGELTSDLPDAAPPASATLTVDEAPLIALMSFSPSTIAQGGVSRLSYDLRNDAVVGATSISLSDTLPADVAVAPEPNAATTCGGTLTAAAGGDTIAFADGELAAGDTCAISVDVTSAVAGSYSNGPEAVTSSLGASTAAPATLTVNAADAPGFSKAFSPSTIDPGGISRLTFTIDNGANGIEAAGLAFTDAFPAGLVVAGTPNGSTTCTGGTFAPGASDVSLAFTGGAVAAGVSCTISVDVTSAVAGSYPNTSGELTSDLPDAAPPASATLTVDEAPLIALMSFSPSTIAQGGVSRLSYDLRNDAVVGATSISLSDTLPADVAVAPEPNAATTCGGTLTAAAGGDTIAFADGELAAGDTCAISVDVTSAVAGSYSNGPEAVTSSLGASTAAPATLTVNAADAPGFSKAFSPSTIDPGGISRLTFTIDNGANGIEAAGLAFTDAFPAGLVVAGTPNGSTTCTGGTFAPGASDVSLAFTGGAVAAGVSCTISVDVTSAVAGSYPNTSGELTSDLPDAAPPASATLTVDEAPLIALMSFSPSTIAQGGVSRLSYDLRNDAVVGATSISLSDTLPADVAVADAPNAATTCGGTLTAAAGGDTIAFADGELGAGDTCAIALDVTSAVAGSYSNGPETVTSSLGTGTAASATLTVDAAGAGIVTFNVESDTDGIFSFSSAEPVLTISLDVKGGTGSTGALPVATDSYSVAVAAPTGVALTAMVCDDTDSTADVSAAMISVTVGALEVVTCTLTARSSVQPTVETINSFLTRRADLILSSESNPNRRFERLKHGSGQTSTLRFSNGDLEALVPFTGQQGGNGNFEFSTSLLQARQAAASVALVSGSAGEVAYVENHRFDAWFEAQYRTFGGGADEHGDFAIAHTGVDYLLTPDVLVGALVSFDTMEELTDTGTVSGFGYMFGPYMTARLASNLYFDGHVAVGRSDNRISLFDTYTDTFSTRRWLARASLTGEAQHGNWTIRPHARLSYFEEPQQRYVDSVGATIPGQTVRLGQIKIGPTFTGRFEGPEGRTYSPYLEVEGIYNTGDTLTNTNGPEVEGWRARLKAGVGMTTEHGTRLSLGATHDGIGRSDFESWGLTFELAIPFGKP